MFDESDEVRRGTRYARREILDGVVAARRIGFEPLAGGIDERGALARQSQKRHQSIVEFLDEPERRDPNVDMIEAHELLPGWNVEMLHVA